MLHLHGSVHFDMPLPIGPTSDLHEICWQPDLGAKFQQNASGRSSHRYAEGAQFPTSVIVAGYGKTSQILRRPFRTYHSELDRLVCNCDALLVAGYGFGDVHLNIAFETYRDARRRPVAIIGYAADDTMTMGGAGNHDPMIITLIHTFGTELTSMRALGRSAPGTVQALRAAKEFEVSVNPDTPLASGTMGWLLPVRTQARSLPGSPKRGRAGCSHPREAAILRAAVCRLCLDWCAGQKRG